jgi:CDP-diacylglycerol--glycerol-3-phosphate 3-phosphatidyltransferase
MSRGLLAEVAGILARTGLTPNMLTWLGLVLNAVTAWVLFRGAFTAGGVLVLVAGLFDALDGSLARATGRVSAFGAFLDSTLDRLSEAVLYFGLLLFFAGQPGSQQEIALTYLAIIGSLMVSYARARAEGLGYECKVGLFTRFERVLCYRWGCCSLRCVWRSGFLWPAAFSRRSNVCGTFGRTPPGEGCYGHPGQTRYSCGATNELNRGPYKRRQNGLRDNHRRG